MAVNVHVMKRLLLVRVFPCHCMSDLSGCGLGTTLRISIWRDFFCGNVPVFIVYMYMEQFSGSLITGEMWLVSVNKFQVRGRGLG